MDSNETIECFCYQLMPDHIHPGETEPSKVYKNVIIHGAIEHKLPEEYIKFLKEVPDNGYNGEVEVHLNLAPI